MSLVREANNKNSRVIWANFCQNPFLFTVVILSTCPFKKEVLLGS